MKTLFWDTSAFLGLVFSEPHSCRFVKAWETSDAAYGWRWLIVESFAALTLRKASPAQWERLHQLVGKIQFVDFPPDEMDDLCRANQKWGLRSADAAHLYVFDQLTVWIPSVELVCCDMEMLATARALNLRVWKEERFGDLKEPVASYGKSRRARLSKKQTACH